MCDHGDTVLVRVWRPEMSSRDADGSIVTWPAKWYDAPVDRCIAPIVEALVAAGIYTTDSCCGHGKGPGDIMLADGRVLMIHPDKSVIKGAPR